MALCQCPCLVLLQGGDCDDDCDDDDDDCDDDSGLPCPSARAQSCSKVVMIDSLWWLLWWLWWWCGWTCTTARGAKSCHKVKNMTTGFIVNWVFDVKDLCSGRRSPWSWAARRWHQWWGNLPSLASGQQFKNLRMEKNMISKVENIWAWRVRRSRKGLSRLPPKIRGGTGEKIKGGSGEK